MHPKIKQAIAALENGTVTELSLVGYDIDNAIANALATALAANTTVKTLDLYRSNIRNAGAFALVTALKTNNTLETLNLRANQIFDDAFAIQLATILETNTTLKTLNIRENNISDAGLLALETAMEINTTLETLDFSVFREATPINTSALNRISTFLQRNRRLASEHRFIIQLGTLRQQLAVCVIYQSDDPTQHYSPADKSKRPYFDVTQLFNTLIDLHQKIEEWATSKSPPRAEAIKKLRNEWRATVVLFHLRCVDTPNDDSPITNIHPQVAWAEQCLAQMDVDSEGYKEACYQLGRYYFTRAAKCFDAVDNDQCRAFARTALNYLHVCKQDPKFIEAEAQDLVYGESEIPFLLTLLVISLLSPEQEFSVKDVVKEAEHSVQSKQVIKDYKIHMPNKNEYEPALNLKVPNTKTVPAKINYNEAAILASLKNTVSAAEKIAAFYRLLKLLDRELLSANQLVVQPTSLLSNVSSFFKTMVSLSPKQLASIRASAIQAVKDALIGNPVKGNFANRVATLKGTLVGNKLVDFIAAGHAEVDGKKVETLEEFVGEVTKKNIPELKK